MKGFTFSCLSFDFSLSGSSSHFLLSAFCHRGLRWSRWSRRHYRRFHSTNCHYLQCFSQARNWDYAVIVFTPALRSSGFTLSHLLLHSLWTRRAYLTKIDSAAIESSQRRPNATSVREVGKKAALLTGTGGGVIEVSAVVGRSKDFVYPLEGLSHFQWYWDF